jgi:FKBP-type peptidyl-prolyl cis-trans isomerase 2
MAGARRGDKVKVHYTGTLDDGNIFDTTNDREPLQFTIGDNEIIPGFEQAIIGMNPGDTKVTKVSANRAYGPYRKDLVIDVEKVKIVDNIDPEVGQKLQINQPDGQKFVVIVTDVSESTVTMDANHPLAGKDLSFDILLVDIVS